MLDIFKKNPQVQKIGLFPSIKGWMWINFFCVKGEYLKKCRAPPITQRRHLYEDWLGSHGSCTYNDCCSIHNRKCGIFFTAEDASRTLSHLTQHTQSCINVHPIKRVTYGISHHMVDVTQRIILANNTSFHVTNALAGVDPYFGKSKIMHFEFGDGSKCVVNEGDYIQLSSKL
jgi:hypothetical protein